MENGSASKEKHIRDSITPFNCQPVNTGDYRLIIGRATTYIALRTITANLPQPLEGRVVPVN
jgi:hypothetical protein